MRLPTWIFEFRQNCFTWSKRQEYFRLEGSSADSAPTAASSHSQAHRLQRLWNLKRFRQYLFLPDFNLITVTIPPCAKPRNPIPQIANAVLSQLARKYSTSAHLDRNSEAV